MINRRTSRFWFASLHFSILVLQIMVSSEYIISITHFNIFSWDFLTVMNCSFAHHQIFVSILSAQCFISTSNVFCLCKIFAIIFTCILLIEIQFVINVTLEKLGDLYISVGGLKINKSI